MFQRHQPRKYVQPTGGNGDIMVAAAKFYAAIFDDTRTTQLCAIRRRQLLQPQHAVRHTVDGFIGEVKDMCKAAAPWRRNLQNNA